MGKKNNINYKKTIRQNTYFKISFTFLYKKHKQSTTNKFFGSGQKIRRKISSQAARIQKGC